MLAANHLDECRRLVALVDALYDKRVRVHVLASCSPEGLFERLLAVSPRPPRHLAAAAEGGGGEGGGGGAVPPIPPDPEVHECRPLTPEERLMCHRAVSRLRQMCPPAQQQQKQQGRGSVAGGGGGR